MYTFFGEISMRISTPSKLCSVWVNCLSKLLYQEQISLPIPFVCSSTCGRAGFKGCPKIWDDQISLRTRGQLKQSWPFSKGYPTYLHPNTVNHTLILFALQTNMRRKSKFSKARPAYQLKDSTVQLFLYCLQLYIWSHWKGCTLMDWWHLKFPKETLWLVMWHVLAMPLVAQEALSVEIYSLSFIEMSRGFQT